MQKTEKRQTEHQKLLKVPKHELWKHKTAMLCHSMLPCCLCSSSAVNTGQDIPFTETSYPVLVTSCWLCVRLLKIANDHIQPLARSVQLTPHRTDCTEATQTPSSFQSLLKTGYSCLKFRFWSETLGQNYRASLKYCSSVKP